MAKQAKTANADYIKGLPTDGGGSAREPLRAEAEIAMWRTDYPDFRNRMRPGSKGPFVFRPVVVLHRPRSS